MGAIRLDVQVEIVANDLGNRITPSWVAFTPEGEMLVGDAAKNQVGDNPENTLYDVRGYSFFCFHTRACTYSLSCVFCLASSLSLSLSFAPYPSRVHAFVFFMRARTLARPRSLSLSVSLAVFPLSRSPPLYPCLAQMFHSDSLSLFLSRSLSLTPCLCL